MALLAGALAGLVTAVLNVRFGILHLLASILTMIALFSINLRIMGRPNIALLTEPTVLTPLEPLGLWMPVLKVLAMGAVALVAALLLVRFLASDYGLAMRATGANPRMAQAQGVRTGPTILVGMALSNALVALAGALFAQTAGFADISIGTGTIVVGLAAVIVGETILPSRHIGVVVLACLVGSILYRLAVALALNSDVLGLTASDLNLVTAVLVGLALILPNARNPLKALLTRRAAP
jgi:putative ABC transport system permease protein